MIFTINIKRLDEKRFGIRMTDRGVKCVKWRCPGRLGGQVLRPMVIARIRNSSGGLSNCIKTIAAV